jgi:hypothetical protein
VTKPSMTEVVRIQTETGNVYYLDRGNLESVMLLLMELKDSGEYADCSGEWPQRLLADCTQVLRYQGEKHGYTAGPTMAIVHTVCARIALIEDARS